jgi:hypothetical protein
MTRRRNPPPRQPLRPQRSKEQEIDNDLRLARATRKAESMQKQQLRRQQWDNDYDDVEVDPDGALPGDDELIDTPDVHEDEDADEDEDDRG